MPRPNRSAERREALLPVVARAFAALGYRRATTAELAERCDVRVNVLYRLWPSKKEMFVAAIRFVYDRSASVWAEALQPGGEGGSAAERILAYETEHHGEARLYRILFAGLNETDDPAVREALEDTYRRFHEWVRERIEEHRRSSGRPIGSADEAAWAVVGLGTIANISRELDLLAPRRRARLIAEIGRLLLEGREHGKGA